MDPHDTEEQYYIHLEYKVEGILRDSLGLVIWRILAEFNVN